MIQILRSLEIFVSIYNGVIFLLNVFIYLFNYYYYNIIVAIHFFDSLSMFSQMEVDEVQSVIRNPETTTEYVKIIYHKRTYTGYMLTKCKQLNKQIKIAISVNRSTVKLSEKDIKELIECEGYLEFSYCLQTTTGNSLKVLLSIILQFAQSEVGYEYVKPCLSVLLNHIEGDETVKMLCLEIISYYTNDGIYTYIYSYIYYFLYIFYIF